DPWDVTEGVVSLDALLELAAGRIGLDLEVVEEGIEADLVAAVADVAGWLVVTSTFPSVLAEVGRRAPALTTGLVVEAPHGGADPFVLADACGAPVVLVEDPVATPALRVRAVELGRPLWVWTVNDAARLDELLSDPGVAGVVTDDPALAVELRRTR
ncbi:MAG: glycerophosphodiester phosphodiesterase, partial [Actinobacteria bacterium]|nr:glycerophosphodiester phosphodiesterase [Actinomycetota bacterium]